MEIVFDFICSKADHNVPVNIVTQAVLEYLYDNIKVTLDSHDEYDGTYRVCAGNFGIDALECEENVGIKDWDNGYWHYIYKDAPKHYNGEATFKEGSTHYLPDWVNNDNMHLFLEAFKWWNSLEDYIFCKRYFDNSSLAAKTLFVDHGGIGFDPPLKEALELRNKYKNYIESKGKTKI